MCSDRSIRLLVAPAHFAGLRFPLKGSFKVDLDIDMEVDVDVDVEVGCEGTSFKLPPSGYRANNMVPRLW